MLKSPHFPATPPASEWSDSASASGLTSTALSATAVFSNSVADPLVSHHEIEQSIWSELHSIPGVHFSTLTVRRVRDGVCLQGVMEAAADEMAPDICGLVRRVAQIENVLNQLLVREPSHPPRLPR